MRRASREFFCITVGSRQSCSIRGITVGSRQSCSIRGFQVKSESFLVKWHWSAEPQLRAGCCWQLQHGCRRFSSQPIVVVRKDGPWHELPSAQKEAWEALGWTQHSWEGTRGAPVSEMKSWEELSSLEQGAAQYGLGYTRETWNLELEEASLDDLVHTSSQDPVVPPSRSATESSSQRENSVTKTAWDLGMQAVPFVRAALASTSTTFRRSGLGIALNAVADLATDVHEGVQSPVVISGTENIVYLDDSGSMSGSRLSKAQGLWGQMAQKLQTHPTRIVKFGSMKTVLVPRSERQLSSTTAVTVGIGWDATSGSTYLWHMILEDVQANYRPGSGHLRVFVVTDGSDTDSPQPYSGMTGMDPMMRDLKAQGFDIEFHIVFVSSDFSQIVGAFAGASSSKDYKRYEDLALATGGGFLHLTGTDDSNHVKSFLDRIGEGESRGSSRLRVEAKQAYEQRVRAGKSTNFDWYVKLPPK